MGDCTGRAWIRTRLMGHLSHPGKTNPGQRRTVSIFYLSFLLVLFYFFYILVFQWFSNNHFHHHFILTTPRRASFPLSFLIDMIFPVQMNQVPIQIHDSAHQQVSAQSLIHCGSPLREFLLKPSSLVEGDLTVSDLSVTHLYFGLFVISHFATPHVDARLFMCYGLAAQIVPAFSKSEYFCNCYFFCWYTY